MNWYDKSKFDLESITPKQWQEINDRMCALGYNWRGPEDAKKIYNKLNSLPEDHKKVLDAVVNNEDYVKKNDPKETRSIFNKAIRYFGVTSNLSEAGSILPNGVLLDFSGKKFGASSWSKRELDHREIGDIISMDDFIKMGAIRHFPEQPGVDIRTKPTEKQINVIWTDVEQSSRGYVLELFNYTKPRYYNRYDAGVKAERIVNDIRKFYSQTAISNSWYKVA